MEDKNSLEQNRQDMLIKAKGDALKLIHVRARSVNELTERLKIKRYPEDIVSDVIEAFKRQGFLDDEKFAKLFASARIFGRPAGKRQVELELKRKGLSEAVVQKTIGEMRDYDEKKAAKELIARRFEQMKGLPSQKIKARLFAFLQRRGFNTDVIYSVINELLKEDGSVL